MDELQTLLDSLDEIGAPYDVQEPVVDVYLPLDRIGEPVSFRLVILPENHLGLMTLVGDAPSVSERDLKQISKHTQFGELQRQPETGDIYLMAGFDSDAFTADALLEVLSDTFSVLHLLRDALSMIENGESVKAALKQAEQDMEDTPPVLDFDNAITPDHIAHLETLLRTTELVAALGEADDPTAYLRDNLDAIDNEVLDALDAIAKGAAASGDMEAHDSVSRYSALALAVRAESDPELADELEHIQRLLTAGSMKDAKAAVEAWPQALLQLNIDGLLSEAESTLDDEVATRARRVDGWLKKIRRQEPLLTAVVDLLDFGDWEECFAFARANPLLRGKPALKQIEQFTESAGARKKEADAWREIGERLAAWQANNWTSVD